MKKCPRCGSDDPLTKNWIFPPHDFTGCWCDHEFHEPRYGSERELLRRILIICLQTKEKVLENNVLLHDIHAILATPKLLCARIFVMPKTINVGESANATLQTVWSDGQSHALDATYAVSYSASNPASVTFGTPNPDGSDTVTGTAPDPGNSISAVITTPGGTQITAAPDTLIINAAAATLVSASVVLQ